MRDILGEVRLSLRQFRRHPAFTGAALLTLALGIGVTTSMFSVVDGVLLRPLPFPDADRLVTICETNESMEGFCVASPPNAADWASQSRALQVIGLGREWPFTMRKSEGAVGVDGGYATPELFRALGVVAARGRLFDAADQAEARPVAILSHAEWTASGSDPDAVGRSIVLDGRSYEVIGVLPAGAAVPELEGVSVWVPPPFDPRAEQNRRWRGFVTIGRLAAGARIETAQAELAAVQQRLAAEHPETNRGWGVRVVPTLERVVGGVRPTLLVFLAASAILLLVACANVAGLLVARGAERHREFAVRAAIGAGPARVLRLVVVESLVLGAFGGSLGVLLAAWLTDVFLALVPPGLPRAETIHWDARVAAFALLFIAASSLLAAAGPAVRAMRVNLTEAMKQGSQFGHVRRALGLRGGIVAAEVALAFVLATGAGLLARSFTRFLAWDPGFERQGLLTFNTVAPRTAYPDRERILALWDRLQAELQAIPGVRSVGMTSSGPLFGGAETGEFVSGGDTLGARYHNVSPDYFRTLGVALRRGRWLTAADREGAPLVALVNETLARRLWPGRDPIGQSLRMKDAPAGPEVVGVVADVPQFVPGRPVEPEVYWTYAQSPRWGSWLVIRAGGDPAGVAGQVRARLRAVDPDLEATSVMTMAERVERQLRRPRFNMLLIAAFASVALLLTAVGAYGVVAATVASRTREIGVRIALGAGVGDVVRMVLRQGMTMAGVGLAAGAALALVLTRLTGSLLPGVRATDPLTWAAVAALVLAVAAAACWIPARRAALVDPKEALREE